MKLWNEIEVSSPRQVNCASDILKMFNLIDLKSKMNGRFYPGKRRGTQDAIVKTLIFIFLGLISSNQGKSQEQSTLQDLKFTSHITQLQF